MYRDMAKENDKLHDEFASTFSTSDVNGNHAKTLIPFLLKNWEKTY